jgi:hypothetical protein
METFRAEIQMKVFVRAKRTLVNPLLELQNAFAKAV